MLLRFYEFCPAYIDGVDGNNATFAEKFAFMETPPYRQMVDAVSTRAGLELSAQEVEINQHLLDCGLSPLQVELCWALCRYESAQHPPELQPGPAAPWCALFSSDDLRVLEFADDLSFYWKAWK